MATRWSGRGSRETLSYQTSRIVDRADPKVGDRPRQNTAPAAAVVGSKG